MYLGVQYLFVTVFFFVKFTCGFFFVEAEKIKITSLLNHLPIKRQQIFIFFILQFTRKLSIHLQKSYRFIYLKKRKTTTTVVE